MGNWLDGGGDRPTEQALVTSRVALNDSTCWQHIGDAVMGNLWRYGLQLVMWCLGSMVVNGQHLRDN